jgi:hypothetical protein
LLTEFLALDKKVIAVVKNYAANNQVLVTSQNRERLNTVVLRKQILLHLILSNARLVLNTKNKNFLLKYFYGVKPLCFYNVNDGKRAIPQKFIHSLINFIESKEPKNFVIFHNTFIQ